MKIEEHTCFSQTCIINVYQQPILEVILYSQYWILFLFLLVVECRYGIQKPIWGKSHVVNMEANSHIVNIVYFLFWTVNKEFKNHLWFHKLISIGAQDRVANAMSIKTKHKNYENIIQMMMFFPFN